MDERASIVAVLALAFVWMVASITAPAAMHWLHLDPGEKPTEGPFEGIENLLLGLSSLLWTFVAGRVRRDPPRSSLAALVALQILVVLGEEMDWGQSFGLGLPGVRNLRILLHERLHVPEAIAAALLMAGLGAFFVAPLVPLEAVRRWLDRIAPVRAEAGDALALFMLPLLWMMMARLGRGPVVEFIQLGAYLVLGVVSLRGAAASRAAALASA